MRITTTHELDGEFIRSMISLYLRGTNYPRKQDFMNYCRTQVKMFGSDYESQFGQEFQDSRDGLTYFMKWFPTEEEKQKDKDYYAEKRYHKSAMKL